MGTDPYLDRFDPYLDHFDPYLDRFEEKDLDRIVIYPEPIAHSP